MVAREQLLVFLSICSRWLEMLYFYLDVVNLEKIQNLEQKHNYGALHEYFRMQLISRVCG